MCKIRGITLHSLRRARNIGVPLALTLTAAYTLLSPVGQPARYFQPRVLEMSSLRTASAAEGDSIVGLWRARFLSGGKVFDEGYDVWTSDGTEILNDTAPPQPANGAGTICLGVYKKLGPRTYKLKHPFWTFDAHAKLAGTGLIEEQVTVAENGHTYSGSVKFTTYDLKGKITDQVSGDIKAERITVE